MKNFFSAISGLFGINRRRHSRIPCRIKANFLLLKGEQRHRGGMMITDISHQGLGCSEVSLFHRDLELSLHINTKLQLYFSLPQADGSVFNFETNGRIKSITPTGAYGTGQRFGIQLESLSMKEKKMYERGLRHLSRLAAREKNSTSKG